MVVQGLGNVGSYTAMISQDEGGMVLVGVSEVDVLSTIRMVLTLHELLKFRKETGSILNYPGSKSFPKERRREVMEFECDVLVPAALENQIHAENAARIKAKIIAEAANGPVTAERS